MKNPFLFFCLLFIGHVTIYAQNRFTDSTLHYRVAISMQPFNLIGQIGGSDKLGPIQIETQRYLTRPFSIGLQYAYQSDQFEQTEKLYVGDSLITSRYVGRTRTNQIMIKGNYKLQFEAPQSKFLNKWGLFAGVGFGLGVLKNEGNLSEPSMYAAPEYSEKIRYLATNVTIGAEMTFKSNLGFYFEGGIALSRIQFGLHYQF